MQPVDPHQLMSCPYNLAHQVEAYRMHIHLQKCRKQHPNSGKAICPFDATHVVNEIELNYHVSTCPKREMLDTQMYVMDDDQRQVVQVQSTSTECGPEDDWEHEANHTSYKPDFSKKGAHVIQKIKGATPSERRKARMEGVKNYRPLE